MLDIESKPVIRTDNGPQFISHVFEDNCAEVNVYHERIPSMTPNEFYTQNLGKEIENMAIRL